MDKIQQLYKLNIELEGLLRVLEQRDCDQAREMLREKFATYSEAINELLAGKPADEVIDSAEEHIAQIADDAQYIEVKDQEAVSAEVEPEDETAEAAIERGESEGNSNPMPMETEAPQNIAPAVETEAHDDKSETETTTETQRNLKVEDMISSRRSAELRKAFTLNDKYRFRRELFAGSDADFNRTIDLIMNMNTFDEARAYLLGTLGWNKQDEAVEDFLNIVMRHFEA